MVSVVTKSSHVLYDFNRTYTMKSNHPYTIKIFVQDGDPEGVRIVEKMNWTGQCVTFPREQWQRVREQEEVRRPGVYVLIGHCEEEDLPKIYVGQAEDVAKRLDSHERKKDFWDRAVVFVSANNALNKAHITWIEAKLIELAKLRGQCVLDNGSEPQELSLSKSEKSDTEIFLEEMLSIYPLLGVRAFEAPKVVAKNAPLSEPTEPARRSIKDTIVVPAREDGFKRVFLGENCWYAIRIAAGKISQLKFIAAYQVSPISAVTHFAPIDSIELYGDAGKYKVIFAEPAQELENKIEIADAPAGSLQSLRYTSSEKLFSAAVVSDLF